MTWSAFISSWWNWVSAISWQLGLLTGIVFVATAILRNRRAAVRHALWLLVLVKVFLPTSISAPWSLSNWLQSPIPEIVQVEAQAPRVLAEDLSPEKLPANPDTVAAKLTAQGIFFIWFGGALVSVVIIAVQYLRLARRTKNLPILEEGPGRIALERATLQLNLPRSPDLRVTSEDLSPFLIGTVQPSIVIPQSLLTDAAPDELETVLLHELVHWKHGDTWIGWVQVIAQCLLWFHPGIWLANWFLNHERETVCDEGVLRFGDVTPERYSETILRVLRLARGRSPVIGGLVGVFERGGRIQSRLESIMLFNSDNRSIGVFSRLAVVAFAAMFLPMAPWYSDSSVHAETEPLTETNAPVVQETAVAKTAETSPEKAKRPTTNYPQVLKITPVPGSINIDPSLKDIRVTFDRDMAKGMSWTGGGPEFPTVDKSKTVGWIDERTCVLPVTLKRGAYYRVGVNSKSHLNFQSADGKPALPTAIFFTTKGASKTLQNKVRIPKIVKLKPANGDINVAVSTREIQVTFDVPMGDGMSWTGGGALFPKVSDGNRPSWSRDGRTCTLPVTLEASHEYKLGLNSPNHNNFQSKWGVPLPPIIYSIHTAAK